MLRPAFELLETPAMSQKPQTPPHDVLRGTPELPLKQPQQAWPNDALGGKPVVQRLVVSPSLASTAYCSPPAGLLSTFSSGGSMSSTVRPDGGDIRSSATVGRFGIQLPVRQAGPLQARTMSAPMIKQVRQAVSEQRFEQQSQGGVVLPSSRCPTSPKVSMPAVQTSSQPASPSKSPSPPVPVPVDVVQGSESFGPAQVAGVQSAPVVVQQQQQQQPPRTTVQVAQSKVLNAIRATTRMQMMAELPLSDSVKMVQAIAATLASTEIYQQECAAVFEALKEPAAVGTQGGLSTFEFPMSKLSEALAHWEIPDEHMSTFWALLRKEGTVHMDMQELPERISFDTFSNVLVKVLRRVRDKNTSLKVERNRFITQRAHRRLEDEYVEKGYIGSGSFGECMWVESKASRMRYVCKSIRKGDACVPIEEIQAELDVMKQLDHPHIMRVFEWFEREDVFSFILEAAHGGDLKNLLAAVREKGRVGFQEPRVKMITGQSLSALTYIHDNGIIHRDIKPANILLEHKLDPLQCDHDSEKLMVLIADFGVAEIFNGETTDQKMRGTLLYMAPEVFAGHISPKADVWAMGVLVQELLSSKRPFSGDNAMSYYATLRRQEADFSSLETCGASQGVIDFVKALLVKDEAARPLASQALSHAWLSDRSWFKHVAGGSRKLRRGLSKNTRMNTVARAVGLCIASQVDNARVEELGRIFESLDDDHNGVLGRDELERGLQEAGIQKAGITLLVDSADINHDGLINYTEFVASLLGTQGSLQDDMLEKAFTVFDENDDGQISLEELHDMLNSGGPLNALLPDGTTVKDVMEAIDIHHTGHIEKKDFIEYLTDQHKEACAQSSASRTPVLSRAPSACAVSACGGHDGTHTPKAKSDVRDHELLSTVFAQIGAALRDAPHPPGAMVSAPDYLTCCQEHAQRLAEQHWLLTAGDARLLRSADWPALGLPLKLQALVQRKLGVH